MRDVDIGDLLLPRAGILGLEMSKSLKKLERITKKN
jgi:hypothetical protein